MSSNNKVQLNAAVRETSHGPGGLQYRSMVGVELPSQGTHHKGQVLQSAFIAYRPGNGAGKNRRQKNHIYEIHERYTANGMTGINEET